MPYFYEYVKHKIATGSDSLIINRRVIDSGYGSDNIHLMYAQIGKSHPGYDCFVFRRELINEFDLGGACIGANYIGRAMLANLIAFSEKLEIVEDAHLTFHLGDEGAWLTNKYSEYDLYNRNEVYQIINRLKRGVKDQDKISKLNDILQFMDSRKERDEKKIPIVTSSVEYDTEWSLKRKIQFKIKQFLS